MEGNDLKRVIADPNNIVKSAFASKQHGDLSNPKNRNRVNSDSNSVECRWNVKSFEGLINNDG